MESINVFWFRRDLRLDDNRGLYHAMKGGLPVLLLFIFDKNILNGLARHDARVTFIYKQITALNNELKQKGTSLVMRFGSPDTIWQSLIKDHSIQKVYVNHDYEPYARERDQRIAHLLNNNNIEFITFKDQVLLERSEVVKENGDPYVMFTPYSRQWLNKISPEDYESLPSALLFKNFVAQPFEPVPGLKEMGFEYSGHTFPSPELSDTTLAHYKQQRDYPAKEGTSRLGIHLRFGTVSIRKIAALASEKSNTFLNELVWREFYQMILWHFPKVVNENFQTRYNHLQWRNDEKEFDAWCKGQTGFPIVDAGMRELNATGYMHNRVRMITASFLTKHLLIDWRWGEAYFAGKLLDYELASNNGGWQWAAGTGVDAAPYFRVFNPELQAKKFDPQQQYIKRWIPEFEDNSYPKPMVNHKEARERAIKVYKKALGHGS